MKRYIILIAFFGLSFVALQAQELWSNNENSNEKNTAHMQRSSGSIKDDREFKVLFSETFENGKGSFSCFNTKGPLLWHDSRCKFMKISGFMGGTKYENEAWLISPKMDFSRITDHIELSFQHAGKLYGAKNGDLTLWISTDCQDEQFGTATWKQHKIPVYMNNDMWIFVASGNIDLDDYIGQPNVRFAFKYNSTKNNCATWQIRNVKVIEVFD
ncbi:MAG: choice-of-anchor J domain-containing protein [Bacteroidales bacterium]|nr:choice-of-anchor J domain-containing protein [Bacteroidales bacterium]